MENSTFWSKFLLFDAILLVLTGLDFVISSFLFPEAIKIVYNLYWGNELSISVNQFNYLKLLFSVTGAIMVGFGITISTLAYYLIKNGDQQFVWTSVTFGLLDWFVLDSNQWKKPPLPPDDSFVDCISRES